MRPHAVSSASGWSYQYDANGNTVTRTLGSDTCVLKYDVGGRVVEVQKNYNRAADFYQHTEDMHRVIHRFVKQAERYTEYADEVIFYFKGSVPDAVREAMQELGVIVEVIP